MTINLTTYMNLNSREAGPAKVAAIFDAARKAARDELDSLRGTADAQAAYDAADARVEAARAAQHDAAERLRPLAEYKAGEPVKRLGADSADFEAAVGAKLAADAEWRSATLAHRRAHERLQAAGDPKRTAEAAEAAIFEHIERAEAAIAALATELVALDTLAPHAGLQWQTPAGIIGSAGSTFSRVAAELLSGWHKAFSARQAARAEAAERPAVRFVSLEDQIARNAQAAARAEASAIATTGRAPRRRNGGR